jgi:hypothetical protein
MWKTLAVFGAGVAAGIGLFVAWAVVRWRSAMRRLRGPGGKLG